MKRFWTKYAHNIYKVALIFYFRGDKLGKFTDVFRQKRKQTRNIKLRSKYINSFPWYDGSSTQVRVVDALDLTSDAEFTTEIVGTGSGYSKGLMFELASRILITEIKCPKCGKIAELNIHWQGFKCEDAVWEILQ